MSVNIKPVIIRDVKAVRLVRLRALRENRSVSNSASTTIIEALSKKGEPEKRGEHGCQ